MKLPSIKANENYTHYSVSGTDYCIVETENMVFFNGVLKGNGQVTMEVPVPFNFPYTMPITVRHSQGGDMGICFTEANSKNVNAYLSGLTSAKFNSGDTYQFNFCYVKTT